MRVIRDCNVAVIGGAGFLGSHLVEHLIERNCRVLVVDNLISGRREFVHKDADFEHHDITGSEDFLRGLFCQYKVRFVANYAAHPYIPLSFERPIYVADTNFMGAMKVINAAQDAGAEAILQVSSAEIYGSSGERVKDGDGVCRKLRETDEVIPHSTYGVAKAAVDYYVQTGWRERKTPCIALRQFNCLGERDCLHPYVLPAIYEQIASQPKGMKCTVRLGNNSSRDFLYARDQARIATELLEKGAFGEVYNLGSETGIKVYDLAKLVGKLMGFSDVEVIQDPARVRPWEIWTLLADNSKIYSVVDARPQVGLEESVARTIKWLSENTKGIASK